MKKLILMMLAVGMLAGNAGAESIVETAIKQSHEFGFMGCDTAIKAVLDFAKDGQKAEVHTYKLKSDDNIRIVTSFNFHDSIKNFVSDAFFYKQDGYCKVASTFIENTPYNCNNAFMNNWTYYREDIKERGEAIWASAINKDEVVLIPAGSGCSAINIANAKFILDK